ncbi:MAG: phage terminase small subunit P27 family [Clostridium celatum]|nr:phage terminase small subunit P27 family [Clostridium celatum]MDU4979850.1 phage terminase small subunit P27 family [Clostridium celatum]
MEVVKIGTKILELSKKHYTKEEIENKKKNEESLYGDNKKLKSPSWLNEDGKKEFKRVVSEMREIEAFNKMLSNLDLTTLAIYSDAYANYVELTKKIHEEGTTCQFTNTKGQTNTIISPLVQAQMKYIDIIMKCSTKLGLSVSDRLKLVVPNTDKMEENKFLSYVR